MSQNDDQWPGWHPQTQRSLVYSHRGEKTTEHFKISSFPSITSLPPLPPSLCVNFPPPTAWCTASSRLCQLGRPRRWQHARHAERSAWIRLCETPRRLQTHAVSSHRPAGLLRDSRWLWGPRGVPPTQHTHKHTPWLLTHLCLDPRERHHSSSWECYIIFLLP